MRTFLLSVTLIGFVNVGIAETPKPGSPEWERKFAEHQKKFEAMQKKSSGSLGRLDALRSKYNDPAFRAAREKESAEWFKQQEQKTIDALPAKYRKAFEAALNPAPFERDKAPSVERTVAHLQKVIGEADSLEDIAPYLSAPMRQRCIQILAGTSISSKTPQAELQFYQDFFGSIVSYDHALADANPNFAYAFVWTRGTLYKIEFVGEGKMWRLAGWEGQLSRS